MSGSRSVVSSARWIALCTLISRVTGLVRDMLMAQTFGLVGVFDAFNYAFQFPNLFRRLFGEGALAAAFVPVFTRTLENEGAASAWKLLSRSLALLSVALCALIIAIELMLLGIWVFGRAADPDALALRHLLLSLTAMMLPFMLTICVVALFSSALNCLGSFVIPALMPIVLNIAMILGILVIGPAIGGAHDPERLVYAVAGTVLVAGVTQVLILIPVLRRHGVQLGWKFDTRDRNVRHMLGLMVPVLIGQGVLVLGPFLDSQVCVLLSRTAGGPETATWFGVTFAYPLREGALSALTNAQRLYQFPLGVLAISLAVAALPTFTRLANREQWDVWAADVSRTVRLALFVGVLTGTMMIVWASPIVRLLFEYRRFDAADTARVSAVMFWYGFGLSAFCVQHIVLRAFYSLGDVKTPLRVAYIMLPFNLMLSLVLVWLPNVREAAFAIASAITSTITVIIGLFLLQRRTGVPLLTARFGGALLRMVAAAAAAGFALRWAGAEWLSGWTRSLESVLIGRGVETFTGLAIGAVVFIAVAIVLRLPEPWLWMHRGERHARV